MSHDERGSTATTAVFLLLGIVLGAALGYWYASRSLRVEPPPAPAPKVREMAFRLEKSRLVEYHQPIVINVDRGDRILWKSDTVKSFEVTLTAKSAGAPPNPFGAGEAKWATENGRLESGRPIPAAKGHEYKTTIRAGGVVYDPHIIFE